MSDPVEGMRRATTGDPIVPTEIDTTVAHSARVWNYWLGGKDYYKADRAAGERVREILPDITRIARADREFLGRVVRLLAREAGIRQFLDIGTGLPTGDNTHEVAQLVAPDSRVVYVDNDPIVLAHARALLTSTPEGVTDYVEADARDVETILDTASRTLDFTRPVAVMMLGVLNFVLDSGQAQRTVTRLMRAVPSGSFLAITHPTYDIGDEDNAQAVEVVRFWNENATPPICARTRKEVAGFLDGLQLLEPGIVSCSRWRPESGSIPKEVPELAALGQKP